MTIFSRSWMFKLDVFLPQTVQERFKNAAGTRCCTAQPAASFRAELIRKPRAFEVTNSVLCSPCRPLGAEAEQSCAHPLSCLGRQGSNETRGTDDCVLVMDLE